MTVPKSVGQQVQGADAGVGAPSIPEAPRTSPAVAQMEEILNQTIVNALNNVRHEDLIGPRPDEELRKGNTYSSTAWVHAPGNLQMLAKSYGRLVRVANMQRNGNETEVKHVDRVEARLVPGTKLLVLRYRPSSDQTAEPVTRHPGRAGAWVNLFDLLAAASLTVEKGYRELYAVHFVPSTSPLWPALVIDLGAPLDRRLEPKCKKEEEAKAK